MFGCSGCLALLVILGCLLGCWMCLGIGLRLRLLVFVYELFSLGLYLLELFVFYVWCLFSYYGLLDDLLYAVVNF